MAPRPARPIEIFGGRAAISPAGQAPSSPTAKGFYAEQLFGLVGMQAGGKGYGLAISRSADMRYGVSDIGTEDDDANVVTAERVHSGFIEMDRRLRARGPPSQRAPHLKLRPLGTTWSP